MINKEQSIPRKFDLTQSQLMMWMGQKLSPDSPMYNMAITFDIDSTIDVQRFRSAFSSLIRQCDVMRTVFMEVDGQPSQMVLPAIPYELEYLDFSERVDKEQVLTKWIKKRSQQVFDITALLFDAVLIKMEEQCFVWFFNQHHLITDAWAMTIQCQKLAVLYKELSEGSKEVSTTLPLFKDYILFESAQRQSKANQQAIHHWSDKARALPEPPAFFGQSNRQMDSRSERFAVSLGQKKSAALRALTAEPDLRSWTQHLSLFNIFATLLVSYLYRLSGQQKLAIGTPAHNRTNTAFKETPGLFIELFPLMAEIDTEETFSSLLKKVSNESLEFLKYARSGAGNQELNRGFNVVLNYINVSFSDFNGTPMTSEWIHADHADPGHHMRMQVHDFNNSGAIELCFDLNVAVFDTAQRAAVAKQYMLLLDQFIADRFQQIGKPSLSVHSDAITASDTFSWDDKVTVLDLFESQAEQLPGNAEAICYNSNIISYPELEDHANRLSHYLIQNGLNAGDNVAILLQRSPEFIISVLAVLKANATFVPLPVNYPAGRILGIIEDADPKLILTNSVIASKLPKSFDHLLLLDQEAIFIQQASAARPERKTLPTDLAYLMYTSGSTGLPKGVMIEHRSLSHYIQWAAQEYAKDFRPVMPLFTSIGFDLTITALFLPLIKGGTLMTYQEPEQGPDLSLLDVLSDNKVNLIKLTPSHLAMLGSKPYHQSLIKCMIVGGENFKTDLAEYVTTNFQQGIRIFNEYGPTEATVGCLVHLYNSSEDGREISVPIGHPIPKTEAYILDDFFNLVPEGVQGELYIGGIGLARGYWNQMELNKERFVPNPFEKETILYRSGDLVRQHSKRQLEYLGRKDMQVKIRGRRVELAEIETVLNQYPAIIQGVVDLRARQRFNLTEAVHNCAACGLPSNYPSVTFDEKGICSLCQSFTSYQEKVKKYFKTEDDLKALFDSVAKKSKGDYDCIALLSGGKDSTYALAKLKEMGLNVLAFTLDNGYISEGAKENITRVVNELGVEHVFGETEAMNAIFVDSLQRHCNVCDGCFKTIYTLSVQLALEKNIPFIVTGLSRGQFFETRLTEELFRQEEVDVDKIDETILNARKAYHQVDDAVKELLDVSMFEDDQLFEKVRFVDYYRYSAVSLEEMMDYLDTRLPWVRPSDTGRSTNCLINKAGIYVHKKERGYSNYAFPYSWDVRVGHKTRGASLEEINEVIPEAEVKIILDEIGYTKVKEADVKNEQLVAYYTGNSAISEAELRNYLRGYFPDYMVPVQFIHLDTLPITVNGKIDRAALPAPDAIRPVLKMEYVAPQTEFEEIIVEVWSAVLQINKIGVNDNFIDIGGDSLSGIRIMARISEALELDLPVNLIFQKPTVARLAEHLEETIKTLLMEMDRSGSE